MAAAAAAAAMLAALRFAWCFVLCLPFPLVGASAFPAIFVFGDSLLDAGNAETLVTLVKASQPPYGRDFVTHQPTGRFSDGLICPDIIASLAGLPFPAPYLIYPNDILQGSSFATSGARIINLTLPLIRREDFTEQVGLFSDVRSKLIADLGAQQTSILLSKALFLICFGTNDYTASDFASQNSRNPPPPDNSVELRNRLISAYEQRVLDLYNLGARKFALVSISVVGCIPFELLVSQSVNGTCDSTLNNDAINFNSALLQLSKQLQSSVSEAFFTYLDAFNIVFDIIRDAAAYGFIYNSTACIGAGPYNGLPCYRSVCTACQNASEYVFWDFAHPTQGVNEIISNRFWKGSSPDVNPINLLQLSRL